MLTALHIKNYTLVEELEVDFYSGLTAITGETGTGKSLVLDALAMALGDRADTCKIRQEADRAEITAYFDLSSSPEAMEWLADQDFPVEAGEVLLRRQFTRDGRSRGSINGASATMQQLRTLGEMLVDIHSQHEHQSLLRGETHRQMLDSFAGVTGLAAEVEQHFMAWQTTGRKLTDLANRADELASERELLCFQVDELDKLGLKPGDLDELEQQQALLSNAEAFQESSFQVLQLLRDDDTANAEQLLRMSLQKLESTSKLTPEMEGVRQLLDTALIEIQEAANSIQTHLESFEADPQRLAELDEQLSTIYQLARKHKIAAEQLPQKHQELKQQLEALGDDEFNIEALRQTLQKQAALYQNAAKSLSSERNKSARVFAEKVNGQLKNLAMPGASIQIDLQPNPNNQFSRYGDESVEILVATNPKQPHGALSKIASGGELSRISLAIQVVAAERCQTPTLIFDEVDVGVGGATAGVVGKLLRDLGAHGQVICVTHLPQVASCAHRQLVAEKSISKGNARSNLKPLTEGQRVDELARMLSAGEPGKQALSHAREMLSAAGN